MVIVQINDRRPDMPKPEWEARYTPERAQPCLSVPGMQWKIWLDGTDERRAGGSCLFADRATAESYANGPIVARMQASPDVGERDIRIFGVRHNRSEITRAPLPALPVASAAPMAAE